MLYLQVEKDLIQDKDYHLAVGARLKKDISSEEFNEWMKGGRKDISIVDEFVGALKIGYNNQYEMVINLETESVEE